MPDPLWIDADAGAPEYSSAELRRMFALPMMYGGRMMGARQGVRPGGSTALVTLSGVDITVTPHLGYVDPALTTTQGGYWYALEVDQNPDGGDLQAAHATFPRKDIVVVRVYDDTEDSSGNREVVTEYIAGTAAAVPAEPAVPAGAMRLATIDVPASGGGSAVVTVNAPFTVASGGVLPVPNEAARTAIVSPYEGMVIHRDDRNWLERRTGSAWQVVGVATCSSTADRDSVITTPYEGQLVVTTDTDALWMRLSSSWVELARATPRRAHGSINVSVPSGGGFVSTNVALPASRFAAAPHVNLTPGSGRLNLAFSDITTASFDIDANNWTAGSSGSVPVMWEAVEKVP